MVQTAQQLIYATPKSVKPTPIEHNLQLYVYKYTLQYGNGMILVAAKNTNNAQEILKRRLFPMNFTHTNMEVIDGATCVGREGILTEQSYHE